MIIHICSSEISDAETLRVFQVLMLEATRRERLKSPLYLRLKKRKTFFWTMSHSAQKLRKGFALGLINLHSVAKCLKNRRGPF